jgi:hypothetical protein
MITAVQPGVAFHSVEFARDAGSPLGMLAVIDGAKSMAMTAFDYWTSAGLRENVRNEFASAVASSLNSAMA